MITSNFDSDIGAMIHTGTEKVTVDEILDATRNWFEHAEFHPQTPVIWDLSDAFLDMTIEEMRNMYTLVRSALDSKRTGGRTGWVHPSGLVRSMISLLHNEFDWGSEWSTFQGFDEALSWCVPTRD